MRCHVYEKFVSCLRRLLFNGDLTIPRLDGNENVKNSSRFRASLHGPGWPGLPVFQGLALPLNPFTSYERAGWLGFRDLCFSNRDLGKLAKKFCHMCNSARFPGWTLAARIASSCIARCIFHIRSILFNCSDTAIRIAKAMIIAEVIGFLCFAMFACFLAFPPELIARIFGLISSRKPSWNFPYEPEAKIRPAVTGPARPAGLMWRSPY